MKPATSDILNSLRNDILQLQGYRQATAARPRLTALGPAEAVFPNGQFPTGAIHEFISTAAEHTAASSGFIAGILGALTQHNGVCLWIGTACSLYPPALKAFGVIPDQVIFIRLPHDKEVLWATEEALKCKSLTAVIAELRDISFTESQRLQLAAEKSGVTAFLLRQQPRQLAATACAARWQISPVASDPGEGLPGVGFPRWQVTLLKVRNGTTGAWEMEWSRGRFSTTGSQRRKKVFPLPRRKTG